MTAAQRSMPDSKNGKKIRVIHKLDEEQVRWIMRQKANGQMSNAKIAELMGVSDRWVRKAVVQVQVRAPRRHHVAAADGPTGRGAAGPQGALRGVVLLQPKQTHCREA